ncbi:GntR family transcriptional regulator [Synechococcus sp. Nb3U1]|uniref:GntR family transcriptional regulator n=1 Tax=Synechococcus sp. Nb3U1 TaxID=1914529 RepID=UPI001F394E75|nr:GntR family transcriptional regulator [Synechococcus sp. Nb3U1]MCF2969627.1 GntR family transcriptional regulator [Synechococcus sp. Nb3U1]
MMRISIQPESGIPGSVQLFNLLCFAIACGQFPPGRRLPSTRQLAMQTGLHRNTINKVYHQLEEMGLVETRAASGIYVSGAASQVANTSQVLSQNLDKSKQALHQVRQGIDQLQQQGFSLEQVRDLLLAEIDWRLRCSAQVLVCVPGRDLGTGELMTQQIQQALGIRVQLVPLEDLATVLDQLRSGTVVTLRYFLSAVEAIAQPRGARVLPIEVSDYAKEIDLVRQLPPHACLGLVSISTALLEVAEVIIHSLRGEDLLVLTAVISDTERVSSIMRRAHTLICDEASYPTLRALLRQARADLIRMPTLVCAAPHIGEAALAELRRELGGIPAQEMEA